MINVIQWFPHNNSTFRISSYSNKYEYFITNDISAINQSEQEMKDAMHNGVIYICKIGDISIYHRTLSELISEYYDKLKSVL